ncbi:MAG: 50S ribosomal protein L22 [Patescibacteria group bacterium]|nr:50S ribosomal protein L22 [Patescibacteria group bacterium]
MQIVAKLKYLRLAPRKVRAVLDVIRGLDVVSAEAQLLHLPKRACRPLLKLLHSAVHNALHQYALRKEDLYIKEIFAHQGPTLYRWLPRAFGRATPIRKRSSHLTIVLSVKEGVVVKEKIREKEKEKEPEKEILPKNEVQIQEETSKPSEKKRKGKKNIQENLPLKRKEGFIKKIFRRKTI